jgi:hypothetical protein
MILFDNFNLISKSDYENLYIQDFYRALKTLDIQKKRFIKIAYDAAHDYFIFKFKGNLLLDFFWEHSAISHVLDNVHQWLQNRSSYGAIKRTLYYLKRFWNKNKTSCLPENYYFCILYILESILETHNLFYDNYLQLCFRALKALEYYTNSVGGGWSFCMKKHLTWQEICATQIAKLLQLDNSEKVVTLIKSDQKFIDYVTIILEETSLIKNCVFLVKDYYEQNKFC